MTPDVDSERKFAIRHIAIELNDVAAALRGCTHAVTR